MLPGGGILAAGVAENAQDPKFSLVKLTGSGRLDTTFGVGDDGVSTFDVAAGPDAANALTIAADGDLLLAGSTGNQGDWAVVATRPNGVLDHTYGDQGRVVLRLAHAFEEATDIVAWGSRALVVGRIHGPATTSASCGLKAGWRPRHDVQRQRDRADRCLRHDRRGLGRGPAAERQARGRRSDLARRRCRGSWWRASLTR